MSARKLLFLATEDWFVRSHFADLVRRARADFADVVVAARAWGEARDIEGARLIPTPFARGSILTAWRDAGALRDLLEREKPDLVHAFGLRPIILYLLSGVATPAVLAVTGRGFLALHRSLWSDAASAWSAGAIRTAVETGRAVLAVENGADRAWVEAGRPLPDDRVVLMPGAGIDPDAYTPAPEPPAPPIVVGTAARLVWSKGVDVAVDAVTRLRAQGLDIELHIAGAPDAENPRRVREDELARWRATPGVRVLGAVSDIAGFWAKTHIACIPSRGGEGLPRVILEAAACARAIVTTDTPGCRDFATGDAGLIVPPDNADALAAALKQLAQDAAQRARFAAAARARVVAHYTTRQAADAAAAAWRKALLC